MRQFGQVSFEKEAKDRVAILKESSVKHTGDTNTTATAAISQEEQGSIFVNGCSVSVGTVIKEEAIKKRAQYHSINCNGKAIVTLGLNSILDLSFDHPAAQVILFSRQQRHQLKTRFPNKCYPVEHYQYIKIAFQSIMKMYSSRAI